MVFPKAWGRRARQEALTGEAVALPLGLGSGVEAVWMTNRHAEKEVASVAGILEVEVDLAGEGEGEAVILVGLRG